MLNLEVFLQLEELGLEKPELASAFSIARQLKPHLTRASVVLEAVQFLLGGESEPRRALPPGPKVGAKKVSEVPRNSKGKKRPLEPWRYVKSAGPREGYAWVPSRMRKSGLPGLKGREVRIPGYWAIAKKGVVIKKGMKLADSRPKKPAPPKLGRHYADPKEMGTAITTAMEQKGIGVEELALLMDVTQSAVHNWRGGVNLPRPETFPKLAETLGLQVERGM